MAVKARLAQFIEAPSASSTLTFGGRVTIEREDGERHSYRIVGEDEADPASGSLSYVAAGAALLGKGVDETAVLNGREVEITGWLEPNGARDRSTISR